MSNKPILFSAPMIRAILAGTKTQTRRVLKTPRGCPKDYVYTPGGLVDPAMGWWQNPKYDRVGWSSELPYSPGDRLWVREAHYLTDDGDNEHAVYAADQDAVRNHFAQLDSLPSDFPAAVLARHKKLRPSIHMPRWASRITLEVTGVRVERLNQISEADAQAEGVETDVWDQALAVRNYAKKDGWFCMWGGPDFYADPDTYVDADQICRASYRTLWNAINGGRAWDLNPWVVVIYFNHLKEDDRGAL